MPSGCALSRVWTRGKSGCVVSYMFIEEEPDAERSWVDVGATAKMSDAFGWAFSTVCRVRYCLDYGCKYACTAHAIATSSSPWLVT